MQDNFEKHISSNKDLFDDLTPSIDIWDRIEGNLPQKKTHIVRRIIISASGVAAVFIIALTALKFYTTETSQQHNLLSEIEETENYYNNILYQKKEMLFKLTSYNLEIQNDVNEELAILDSAMIELKEDLNDDISNREVVEAMILNYRMKLKVLEDILKYLSPEQKEEQTNIDNI